MELSQKKLKIVTDYILDKKGHDIVVLDLRGISAVTDYFIIVTGNTPIQTKAITEHLQEKFKEEQIPVLRVEGLSDGRWVLMDCGDLVIHIMIPEAREFYSLERLWGDAQEINLGV
ncbi:iojap-like protein [Syntrophobotulus glycolicus DSM 8271]|uniref:Ribosomal silencing factor RsfS n=1 Tax=Syntrophobotulus glycolicus (strain DSM 8271 / FlGlyR) TaxID=645991 RepID=F0SVG5_SYNGF|nr:ribosome silencing factor [Syntrophobotulus glycolicus]ADY56738.1 iojap-like protein [Syntrophobotulus glycolicus DSM 8271]